MNTKRYTSGIISIALFFTIIATTKNIIAQTRPLPDVRRVTVTGNYVIEDHKATSKFIVCHQELFDSLNRLHSEIEYDQKGISPKAFKLNWFNGKRIIRTDFYTGENITSIKEFEYTPDSLLIKETTKTVQNGDTLIILVFNYKYNKIRKPVEIIAKNQNGKSVYKVKSTFDNRGAEIKRKVKVSGVFPSDSILELIGKPSYDSLGRLIVYNVTYTSIGNRKTIKRYNYKYDKNSNIIATQVTDQTGKQIYREEREFGYSRNRLSSIKIYDTNNKLVKAVGKRYEIYRTRDRRNREIDF